MHGLHTASMTLYLTYFEKSSTCLISSPVLFSTELILTVTVMRRSDLAGHSQARMGNVCHRRKTTICRNLICNQPQQISVKYSSSSRFAVSTKLRSAGQFAHRRRGETDSAQSRRRLYAEQTQIDYFRSCRL